MRLAAMRDSYREEATFFGDISNLERSYGYSRCRLRDEELPLLLLYLSFLSTDYKLDGIVKSFDLELDLPLDFIFLLDFLELPCVVLAILFGSFLGDTSALASLVLLRLTVGFLVLSSNTTMSSTGLVDEVH